MTVLSGLAALLGVQVLFVVLGVGLTARVPRLRTAGWAVLLAPVAGHLALAVLSLGLNLRMTTGRRAVLAAAAILAVLTVVSGRMVVEAFRRFVRRPALVRLVLLSVALQSGASTGLLLSGFRTYNGYGNLDAWYYATDVFLMKDRRYLEAFEPGPLQPHLHTSAVATRVGPEFAVLLVSETAGLNELAAYNLVLASLLPLVPIAAAFLCRQALVLRWRWAIAAAAAAGVHSSLVLAYLNQHLGHLLALAVMPASLAAFAGALRRRDRALAALAALFVVGGMYAYWPTLPLVAGPVGLVALTALWPERRRGRRDVLLAFAATSLGLVLVASPEMLARYVVAMSTSRPVVTRNDPVMMAFNPYLTEDLLPLATGVVEAGRFGTWWQMYVGAEPLRARALIAARHAAGALLVGVALLGLTHELVRRRLVLPLAAIVPLVLLTYVLHREYGYGAYKLVSWGHVVFTIALVVGLRSLWRARRRPGARVTALLAAAGYLVYNVDTDREYVRRSLAGTTASLVTGANFAGNPDWESLEGWAARHREGAVLIGFHSHVAQFWAAYRLRAARYAYLVPQDVVGGVTADEQARHDLLREIPEGRAPVALDPAALSSSAYFLDWAEPADITVNDHLGAPLERNATFALYPLSGVARFVSLRQGWHSFENTDPVTGRRVRFRWMRPRASVLLYRFPAEPVRLLVAARAGLGLPTLDRRVVVSHDGAALGELAFEGTARLLTPPFVPASPVDEVELRVEGDPQPIPRPMTLWNRWVEHDPRPLSVGVSEIRAVEADAAALDAPPRHYSPDEVRTQLLYEGLHADDWLAGRFTLFLPPSVRAVRLVLGVEPLVAGAGPSAARLLLDGRPLRSVAFAAHGDAEVTVELPPAGNVLDLRALTLTCERPLRLPTRDTGDVDMRRISYRLRGLEIR